MLCMTTCQCGLWNRHSYPPMPKSTLIWRVFISHAGYKHEWFCDLTGNRCPPASLPRCIGSSSCRNNLTKHLEI
jgi:hypothetical protein